MKRILITYASISLIGVLLLLLTENLYMMVAIISCILLLAHREIWSLLRYRRLPAIDERVRNNFTNAMKLTGGFFFIANVVLILLLRFNVFQNIPTDQIISGQLVILGIVYLVSYHYYDRVFPSLGERAMKWLKICIITSGLSLSTMALAIVLHNLLSSWLNFEEAFFFILGLIAAPAVLAISLLGSLAIYIVGLWASFAGVEKI